MRAMRACKGRSPTRITVPTMARQVRPVSMGLVERAERRSKAVTELTSAVWARMGISDTVHFIAI